MGEGSGLGARYLYPPRRPEPSRIVRTTRSIRSDTRAVNSCAVFTIMPQRPHGVEPSNADTGIVIDVETVCWLSSRAVIVTVSVDAVVIWPRSQWTPTGTSTDPLALNRTFREGVALTIMALSLFRRRTYVADCMVPATPAVSRTVITVVASSWFVTEPQLDTGQGTGVIGDGAAVDCNTAVGLGPVGVSSQAIARVSTTTVRNTRMFGVMRRDARDATVVNTMAVVKKEAWRAND